MPFTMKNFVFWSGVYNAGLAVFLLFPPLYRGLGLEHLRSCLGLANRWLFGFYQCRIDFIFPRPLPPRCFCLLGIAATLHCRAGAYSSGTVW